MKFDKYEWKILQTLQENSQITNQELAEKIGLSATPCWRRLNDLNQSGVIKKHIVLLDPELVGIKEIVIAHVTIDQKNERSHMAFEDVVKKHPEIMECYASMGDADYLLKVSVANITAYDKFLREFLFKLPGVLQVRSNFALRTIKQSTSLPLSIYND